MYHDLDQISFAEWLVELTICAVRAGYKSPLLIQTGQLCWYPSYVEGLSPLNALRAHERDGRLFGIDYGDV